MGSERRAALLCLALVAFGFAARADVRDAAFLKGVALGGWWRDDYLAPSLGAQLDALKASGVTWVELTARWYQAERNSTGIAPHDDRSPSDASLRHAIVLARGRGLRVFLKPQIDLLGDGWRGEISMNDDEHWATWFASYTRFIEHYAALAREEKVDLLSVAVELDATRHREGAWRKVIAAVRAAFPGKLTWAANWGREVDIRFWDALDYVGIDEYALLEARDGASDQDLRRMAQQRREGLRRFAAEVRKPILFTEIGERSVSRAVVASHDWQRHGPVDLARQQRLVRTWIEVFRHEPWLAGTFWWQWQTTPPGDPASNDDFTPQGKPAWDAIRAFYANP
jgi:hypothetical protein